MKAAFYEKHGTPADIVVGDVPKPELGAHDVLIKVRAASLNGFDPMMLAGTTDLKTPMPMIPCGDFAGEIVEMGGMVRNWKVGDRVCPFPFVEGEGMTGETRRGAAAEYISMPSVNLLRMPDGLSFEDAAALPIAYGTAYRMMVERAKVKAGERVLILGATGGVGICAVDLAKAAGCEVIACGSADWKMDLLREQGADHVIDTSQTDFFDFVKEKFGKPRILGGGGVDVVINYIGGDTWVKSMKCLKKNGRLLTCGATAGFNPTEDIRFIWSFELNVMGSNGWYPNDQVRLMDMVAAGQLKPCIHAVKPLEETGQAMQDLIDRNVFGKIIITP